jgi:predicted PurR-regulated permease PerM
MKNERPVYVDIKPAAIVKTVLVVAASVIGILALAKMKSSIMLVLTAFFLAIALNPPVGRISRIMPKKSRAWSVAFAYIIVLTVLGSMIYAVIPPLSRQVVSFTEKAPSYIEDIKTKKESGFAKFIERNGLEDDVLKIAESVKAKAADAGSIAFSGAQTALGVIFNTITVLVLTFLMLVDGPGMMRKLWGRYEDEKLMLRHKDTAHKMYRVVTGYFNGQVIVACISSSLMLLAMIIAGYIFKSPMPYALLLAAIFWICGLIPLIGSTLGSAVVIGVATFVNWKMALALSIYSVIYQQVENATIQPTIQGKAISMSPLLVLVVVLLSANLGGIFAAFVALPVAGCIQVLFGEFFKDSSLLPGSRRKFNLAIYKPKSKDKVAK